MNGAGGSLAGQVVKAVVCSCPAGPNVHCLVYNIVGHRHYMYTRPGADPGLPLGGFY